MITRYAQNGFSKKNPKNIKGPFNFTIKILINYELSMWKSQHGTCNLNIWVLNVFKGVWKFLHGACNLNIWILNSLNHLNHFISYGAITPFSYHIMYLDYCISYGIVTSF